MTYKPRLLDLAGIAVVLAVSLVPAAAAAPARSANSLITGIDTWLFLAAIGSAGLGRVEIRPSRVWLECLPPAAGLSTGTTLVVHVSVEDARGAYARCVASQQSAGAVVTPQSISEQFALVEKDGAETGLVLRRWNVVFTAEWPGERDPALALRRRVPVPTI